MEAAANQYRGVPAVISEFESMHDQRLLKRLFRFVFQDMLFLFLNDYPIQNEKNY